MPQRSPSASPSAKRQKRAVQARQIFIYTVLVGLLLAAGLYAAAILTGRVEAPFDRAITTPTPEATAPVPPCPVGPDARATTPDQITVNVFNGTQKAGLATNAANDLKARGFAIGIVGNADVTYKDVAEIRTGYAGINSAYTVAAQLSGANIVVDSRTTADLDLILGSQYTTFIPAEEVNLSYDTPLQAPANCQVAPDPAANADNGDDVMPEDGTDTGAEDAGGDDGTGEDATDPAAGQDAG